MTQRTLNLSERVYAFLVDLYPRSFQQRYGSCMKQSFRDLLEDPDVPASRIWFSVLHDLSGSLLHEHLANLTGGRFMSRYHLPTGALALRGALFGFAVVLVWLTFRTFHLAAGRESNPQGLMQVWGLLRLLSPWLLFIPAGFVGARMTRSFRGGIWSGLVAGAIASLTVVGDYLLFQHVIPGGFAPTIVTLAAAAALAIVFTALGAAIGLVRASKRAEASIA